MSVVGLVAEQLLLDRQRVQERPARVRHEERLAALDVDQQHLADLDAGQLRVRGSGEGEQGYQDERDD